MQIDQFKDKFIEEANGLVNQLEESLLLQEENLHDQENADHIFRIMHTLKGVSGMYGFIHISDLAHDLETILDQIRDGMQEFTSPIFEVTLKTVDQFRNLLKDEKLVVKSNQKKQKALLEEISHIVKSVNQDQRTEKVEKQKSVEQRDKNKETFYIIFHPTEDMLFRGVNILLIFENLAGLGQYRLVTHSFKEQDLRKKKQNAWGIYLVTDQGQAAIEDTFLFVLDDCRILKISEDNLFQHEEFLSKIDALDKGKSQVEELSAFIPKENTGQFTSAEVDSISESPETSDAEKTSTKKSNSNKDDDQQAPQPSRYREVGKQLTSQISIDASKLDRLMYLVSELVTTKSELNLVVEKEDYSRLRTIAEKIEDLSRNFRDNALNIRLVAVAEMITPFRRMIRDLSKELGKEVKLHTQGIETELDKNVIDRLAEPIMHILRNCVDHGIESPAERERNNKPTTGNIKFNSFYSGANVYIQIEDDGKGIDPEKIKAKAIEKGLIGPGEDIKEKEIYNLLFQPGFSTAETVSEVSGRGVGMDIVRKKINEVRGEVEIQSSVGKGTLITIKLQQTMSIIDTLLLQVEDAHYLVPVADIEFCEQEKHEVLYKNQNRQVEIDNELIPFVSLRDLFTHSLGYPDKEKMVIINKNDKRVAIVADKIIGEHQAVLKPLGEIFHSQEFLSGASMLGDGTLALMLDTNKIATKSGSFIRPEDKIKT